MKQSGAAKFAAIRRALSLLSNLAAVARRKVVLVFAVRLLALHLNHIGARGCGGGFVHQHTSKSCLPNRRFPLVPGDGQGRRHQLGL